MIHYKAELVTPVPGDLVVAPQSSEDRIPQYSEFRRNTETKKIFSPPYFVGIWKIGICVPARCLGAGFPVRLPQRVGAIEGWNQAWECC